MTFEEWWLQHIDKYPVHVPHREAFKECWATAWMAKADHDAAVANQGFFDWVVAVRGSSK